MESEIIIAAAICVAAVCACCYLYVRSKREFRENCKLMLEAMRNRDYSFRMAQKGRFGHERFLQNMLNEFGAMMGEQKQLMEQRERFYELILSNVATGIVVLEEDGRVVQTNSAALKMLGVPALGKLSRLKSNDSQLAEVFMTLNPGEKRNVSFTPGNETVPGGPKERTLLVHAVELNVRDRRLKIICINDIRNELDTKELDSWTKLTRVLTHEIMNSVAPIASLSETFMRREDVRQSPMYGGIKAIRDTSAGLVAFVDSYRKFSALQEPKPEPFYVEELIDRVRSLGIIPPNIKLIVELSQKDLMLYADPGLIGQVMINLMKNAVQAIGDGAGRIKIWAILTKEESVKIYVGNDGPVIPADVAKEIFVPFFTTKKEGNGIGLPISRQIMQLSNGTINLLHPGFCGYNTTFELEFF